LGRHFVLDFLTQFCDKFGVALTLFSQEVELALLVAEEYIFDLNISRLRNV
jgi:hypothetical protein